MCVPWDGEHTPGMLLLLCVRVSLSGSPFFLDLFFFLFFFFGLFAGTWPGHVQTPTIQQCWRVDSIYLNNGSFFSLLFNPQFR